MNKTLLTVLVATLAPCSFAKQYWVKGVDTNGGWVDVDKSRNAQYNEFENEVRVGKNKGSSGYFNNDRNSGDGFLCWAASATDILAWWHRQNPGAAQLNKKAPTGKEELWQLFKKSFVNDSGAAEAGIRWYIKGIVPQVEPTPKPGIGRGGYYSGMDIQSEHYDIRQFDPAWMEHGGEPVYNLEYNGPKEDVHLKIANKITSLIKDGYIISLGISGEGGGKHATTLWGAETDDTTGHLTKIWITDSDDALNGYGTGLIELECRDIENELTLGTGEHVFTVGKLLACGIKSTGKAYQEEEFRDKKASRLWYDCTKGRNDYFYDFTAIKMPQVPAQGMPQQASSADGAWEAPSSIKGKTFSFSAPAWVKWVDGVATEQTQGPFGSEPPSYTVQWKWGNKHAESRTNELDGKPAKKTRTYTKTGKRTAVLEERYESSSWNAERYELTFETPTSGTCRMEQTGKYSLLLADKYTATGTFTLK